MSEQEAKVIKELFVKYLKSYKEKGDLISDKQWLKQLFITEIHGISEEEAEKEAGEIIGSIDSFDDNLKSIDEAGQNGISKERWLADKIQQSSIQMSVNEYGEVLQLIDDMLYCKNMELAEALQRSSDGHIKMSPNLDGNIAENMIAKTAELSAVIQDKNIKVEVRDVFTENSVDVRATNIDTGKYQNYQLKFGKDADATIKLIERGNYNNQQIIVPKEQLNEVRSYFKAKGSSKTITDHIEAWGAKGKSFTKKDMKDLQMAAQEKSAMPKVDYSDFAIKDIALNIGKNAGVMGLLSAAVTTGFDVANKLFKGEKIEPEELVENAIKTGADTSVKVIATGALKVASENELISAIPKGTSGNIIANIASVGIENAKILYKVAMGKLSLTKGLDRMGRTTTSMIYGVHGAIVAKTAIAKIGVEKILETTLSGIGIAIGGPIAPITGFIGGMVGNIAGSLVGDTIYSGAQKVASVAKSVAKSAWEGIKSTGKKVFSGLKSLRSKFASFLGL